MNDIYRAELAVLRYALWGESPDIPDGLDWKALIRELAQQTVIGLVSAADFGGIAPDDVQERLQGICLHNGVRFYQYLHAQEQLLEILGKAGIPTVILKGAAAAMNYPDPELRVMGDIDFLVPAGRFDETYKLLTDSGYRLLEDEDINPKHIELVRDGVYLELHRSFGTTEGLGKAAAMPRHMEYGLAHALTAACGGSEFPVLPVLQNGLVLLRHAAQHLFHSELGMRQVIDWMMYVSRQLTDEIWESEFRSAASELGLERFAVVLTCMCRRHLGLPGGIQWCNEKEDGVAAAADELLEYVLESGNFGRKRTRAGRWVANLSRLSSVSDIFSQSYIFGMRHCGVLRKYRVLAPAACLYGGLIYAKETLFRRNMLSKLAREYLLSVKTKKMFRKLGLSSG